MPQAIVSPSILSANLLNLHDDIRKTEQAGADWHHVDVMDGHFVPNLSFGIPLIKSLKTISTLPLDVHIMVSNPDQVASQYIEAGSDLLSFHLEASDNPFDLLKKIQGLGCKAGVAIKPETPLQKIHALIKTCDLILIMSVNPGFGGQSFITTTYERLRQIQTWCLELPSSQRPILSVDGGIKEEQAKKLKNLGANALVAGSYIYQSNKRKELIHNLKYL